MTPMIDVVFQLLIYFVLTFEIPDVLSQMSLYRPAPDSPPPSDEPPDLTSIRVGVYEGGVYTLDDARLSKNALQRAFNRAADLDPTQPVIVVATAQSKHKHLVEVLDMLNFAGLETISLISSD